MNQYENEMFIATEHERLLLIKLTIGIGIIIRIDWIGWNQCFDL